MKKSNLILIAILFFIFFPLFLPYPHISTDLHFSFPEELKSHFELPATWSTRGSSGLGSYGASLLWNWPLDVIFASLAKLNISHQIIVQFLGFLGTILIGLFSLGRFFKKTNLSELAIFIGKLFYLTTTYFLLLVDGGQIPIALAYVWLPFCYVSFLDGVDGKLIDKIKTGLIISILGFLDIRFVYIFLLLVGVKFLFDLKNLVNWFKTGMAAAIVFIGLNFYWLFPVFVSRALDLPSTYARTTQTSFLNFTQLRHALFLLQPHWPKNTFGIVEPFRKEFLPIPFLAFLAIILKFKSKEVWFWSIIAAVSIFLTKGANPPLGGVYQWLFAYLPGFVFFRDSTKFFFLVSLSYSVLIGFTVNELIKKFHKLKIVLPVLIACYILFLTRPVYLQRMTGTFSNPKFVEEYLSLAKKLEQDRNHGRVFWIPSKAPLGFSSPLHPTVEASRLESLRPFASATVGSYETQNFIREGNYIGDLFEILNIKYIVYPSLDSELGNVNAEKIEYYFTFLSQISKLPWVAEKISDFPIIAFQTKSDGSKFSLPPNTYFVLGTDEIYSEIKNLEKKLSSGALVFIEEEPGLGNQVELSPQFKVILYDKNYTDLALSFTDIAKHIFLSTLLDFSPNDTGWWKRETVDLVWLRDFFQSKYGIDNLDFDYKVGWAIAEGEKELKIENSLIEKGSILYARVMESSRGGEVSFYQSNSLIGDIDTQKENPGFVTIKLTGSNNVSDKFNRYSKASFHWVRVGEVRENNTLTIKAKGDINVVNSIIALSPDDEAMLKFKVDKLVKEGKVIEWRKLDKVGKESLLRTDESVKVNYERIAPTHYKIRIEGLQYPSMLAFSESFDERWELNGQGGNRLYSLINGYWVTQDGEYDLYYTPQKYVRPGLIISLITLTSCIIVLVWRKERSALPPRKSS